MAGTDTLSVKDDEVQTIVETIWMSLFTEMDLACAEAPVEREVNSHTVTAMVMITGVWEAAVSVECSHQLAERITEVMFELDSGDTDTELIHDAIGEVANMAGGNVKALADGHCQLGLPTVTDGIAYTVSVPQSRVNNQVTFISDGEPFVVTVLEVL